jgi:ABC-type phosphate transport system substrate-binding protein
MVIPRARLRTAILLLAAALAVTPLQGLGQPQLGADIAVVVHSQVPIENLTFAELRNLVLGEREYWSSNVRVTLLIRAPVARERDVVLKSICQMSEAQFRQYWIGKVFRAETPAGPKIVYSDEMAIELVNRIPGAITFVDAEQAKRGLKVIRIDGRLPGERGYALK